MRWFHFCSVKWSKELEKIQLVKVATEWGIETRRTPYVANIQTGECPKCGKIFKRIVKYK